MVVEFREIRSSDKAGDVFLERVIMPAVPSAGETIGIDGYPYVVVERGWTVETKQHDTYCYLRVVPRSRRV